MTIFLLAALVVVGLVLFTYPTYVGWLAWRAQQKLEADSHKPPSDELGEQNFFRRFAEGAVPHTKGVCHGRHRGRYLYIEHRGDLWFGAPYYVFFGPLPWATETDGPDEWVWRANSFEFYTREDTVKAVLEELQQVERVQLDLDPLASEMRALLPLIDQRRQEAVRGDS